MQILYEDNHIIALNKEAGLLTQGDRSGRVSLFDQVKEYLKIKYNKPGNAFLGIVQRLDKPVSGIVIFAKTSKAARRINLEFREHATVKIYIALTENNPGIPTGEWISLEEKILRKKGISEIVTEDHRFAKTASMRLYKMDVKNNIALLLISLKTGKKHQIRTQLSSRSMPILGDTLYGSSRATGGKTICLHSLYLCLSHPVTKDREVFHAPLPERFFRFMAIDNSLQQRIGEISRDECSVKEEAAGEYL